MKPTSTGILWLHQCTLDDRDQVGSKAARLAALERSGFQVPPGFCLPEAAYRQHLLSAAPAPFWMNPEKQNYAQLRAWIQEQAIDPEICQALLDGYHRLRKSASLGVAVRSSSTAEDLQQHSFAGLYSSYLQVTSEAQLIDAVRACWASYWNEEAVAYREWAGIQHSQHGMAVLVQAMAPAVQAGVVYTQVSESNPDIALIEFTREGGEALVSGDTRARNMFVHRRTGRLVQASHPEQELDFSRLLSLSLRVEKFMGAAQDIEWVMDAAGSLSILQTRPVTSQLIPQLGLRKDTSGNGSPGDDWLLTYDEPFSPLGCQIAMLRYRYWVAAINASFKTRFQPKMQNRDGLLYYHPTWRHTGPLLKGWMNFWRLAAWLGSERTYHQYIGHILPRYNYRLQTIEQTDLGTMNGASLMALFHQAIDLYLEFQYTSYAIGAAATLSASLLDRSCRFLFGSQAQWDALDFLTGIPDVSIHRELEIYRLGKLLQPHLPPSDQALLGYADLVSLQKQDGQQTPFGEALQDFLAAYGYMWADRYPRDPAWEMNQDALAASLSIAAQAAPEESLEIRHQQQQCQREEAVQQALSALSPPGSNLLARSLPVKKWVFNILLRRAEKLFPHKENRNHSTYRGMMVIRQIAREIGHRMQARQLLPAAEDLFFLELEEIEMLSNKPGTASWLLKKVNQRKASYLRSRQHIYQRAGGERTRWDVEHLEAIEVKGDPCSPGLAKGPARLVNGPGELQRVRPGEIVVCTQLRPAWSAVFSRAGGVVIEMGSLLSHGSALAREYGIPAVINVADITSLVRENDWLVVDGNQGRVAIERRGSTQQENRER